MQIAKGALAKYATISVVASVIGAEPCCALSVIGTQKLAANSSCEFERAISTSKLNL